MICKYPPHFAHFKAATNVDILRELDAQWRSIVDDNNDRHLLEYNSRALIPAASQNLQSLVDKLFVRDHRSRPNIDQVMIRFI